MKTHTKLDKKHYTVTNLPKSQVVITGTVPVAILEHYREPALAAISEQVEIQGFRKGHAPKEAVIKKVGGLAILEEMAQRALTDVYMDIIQSASIDAIGRPEIVITKIAEGSDLEFKITTAVLPTVTLPNYKKIAKEVNKQQTATTDVSDAEIETAILELRKMRAHQEMHEAGVEHDNHNHMDIDEATLPAFTDEYVKNFGPFESVAQFKEKLAENIAKEKGLRAQDARRMAIVEALLAESGIEVPELLASYELDKMMSQLDYDISMAGLTMEDYLKNIGKTLEDIRTEWKTEAEKRSAMQLLINKIVTEEKLEPTEDELNAEVAKIMEFYKNTQGVTDDQARAYVTTVLTNQKFFTFIDQQ